MGYAASSFFLIKLPWIKELKIKKGEKLEGFEESNIDIRNIKFLDNS